MRRAWPLLALAALALGLGMLASSSAGTDSPLCSIANTGPQGAAALDEWIQTIGARTRALPAPLTSTDGLASIVILGASQRRFGPPEVAQLDAFVRAGGTVVYLPAGASNAQPDLRSWLGLERSERWPDPDTRADDSGGRDVAVSFPHGLLQGVSTLRVAAEAPWLLEHPDAFAAAEEAVWVLPLGEGEVWVAPSTALAENRRLELGDNARFWANLAARGPVGFTEGHLVAPDTSAARRHLWGVAAQLAFVGLVLLLSSLKRLGPARPVADAPARSGIEYVRALANLSRRAQLEPELLKELKARVRRVMHEQAGISPSLEPAEAARALEAAGVPLGEALLKLEAAEPDAAGRDPAQFSSLGRAAAQIERRLIGRV